MYFCSYKRAQGKELLSLCFSLHLTLAPPFLFFFYTHHLPHVALADNRLQPRGRKRQVGGNEKGVLLEVFGGEPGERGGQ